MAAVSTVISRRRGGVLRHLLCLATVLLSGAAFAQSGADASAWQDIARRANGQTVYFNAWGGDPAINRYIAWAATRLDAAYGVQLVHVKVADIAESVSRLLAEQSAGRREGGSIDLLWINGENFAALQRQHLLWGPWTDRLPNAALVDWAGNPTTQTDFTVPTDGYELPWGTATFTLFFDRTRVSPVPGDPAALQQWIEAHPGRFSYPQPPSFPGSAFLRQMLMMLMDEPDRLQRPVAGDFQAVTAPLWAWLDRTHPYMWRGGRLFPRSGPAQRELMASGELDWMMSYNPTAASQAIRQDELQPAVRGLYFPGGALANSHFLAIPGNAAAREAAMLVANFLISPVAQARKADERIWGDPSILAIDKLPPAERKLFSDLKRDAATPAPPETLLPEAQSDWSTGLERAWLERYTR